MKGPARSIGLITFLSDFGLCGGYVAACEAVIARLAGGVRVLHLSHEIGVGNIRWGSMILARLAPFSPPCAHLAVVDPGVGTSRRPVVLDTHRGDLLVGPDNGLLLPAALVLGGVREARLLDPGRVRMRAGLPVEDLSATFHGRDLFAPAVALLAAGVPASEIGDAVDANGLVRPADPVHRCLDNGLVAEIIEVDRFGNVGLATRFNDCHFGGGFARVEVEGEGLPAWEARVVRTFGELSPGELGIYQDSWGQVALALNGASAAQLLSVDLGLKIRITFKDRA